jgi:hypothetical protein
MTAISNKKSDATVLWSGSYTYDHAGNRTRLTEDNGDYTDWSYDDIYQLTDDYKKASGGAAIYRRTFTYDAVGNRLTLTDENSALESAPQGPTSMFRYRLEKEEVEEACQNLRLATAHESPDDHVRLGKLWLLSECLR